MSGILYSGYVYLHHIGEGYGYILIGLPSMNNRYVEVVEKPLKM